MKKKKKYQAGGAEATPYSVDDQIIDYTDFLSPASMDMLESYRTGGVVKSYQSGGGELDGNAVMPFVSFNGDYHNDSSGSRGIGLGLEGDNPRKVQHDETRAFVSTDKLKKITDIGDAVQMAQAGGMEEMIMQMGGPEAMAMAGPPQQGMPQQGMPVQNTPQPPVGQPQDKSQVILGDKIEPESGKEYQELANKLKKIAKNDPNNTRVQDEIKEKMEQLALKQEAQRVMEEQFPDGPPQGAPPEQAQALNENMAMMEMLQGQGGGMQQPGMQQPPTVEQAMDPEAIPLAQGGMVERKSKVELELERMYQQFLEDERQANQRNALVGNEFYDDRQKAAVQIDDVVGGTTPFNTNFLDDDYVNVKQRPGAADYAASEMQTMPANLNYQLPTEALPSLRPTGYGGLPTIEELELAAAQSGERTPPTQGPDIDYAKMFDDAPGDPEDPKDPKKKGKGKTDWAGMATLAGAGIASNIGNIMYLMNEGKEGDKVDPERYTVDPELISLDEQRKDIETRMNRVAYENRMRGKGDITRETFLAGQELQQMAPTYEKEQNVNAQIINSADQFNAQMRMNADDLNAQNKAAAQKQYYDSISQIGQNINNLAVDINQRRENKQMYKLLDGYFPNYSLVDGQWVFTGDQSQGK